LLKEGIQVYTHKVFHIFRENSLNKRIPDKYAIIIIATIIVIIIIIIKTALNSNYPTEKTNSKEQSPA